MGTCIGHGALACSQHLLALMMLVSWLVPIGRKALAIVSHGALYPQSRRRLSRPRRRTSVLMVSLVGIFGISSTTPQSTFGVEAPSGATSRHRTRLVSALCRI